MAKEIVTLKIATDTVGDATLSVAKNLDGTFTISKKVSNPGGLVGGGGITLSGAEIVKVAELYNDVKA